jgi:ankyrin repeat protein
MVYNAILRRFPVYLFETFKSNLFSTTIHVLVSAVQKVSRVTKLDDGSRLYRGFSGKALPPTFHHQDEHGIRGFAEWGFMSTTSDMRVAVSYSGAIEGRANALVFVIPVGSVDRGACIQQLSQYPGEEEILWLPLSFIAPAGDPYVEDVGQGLVKMLPLRVNANLKARTVEELLGQKKQAHLASFRQMQEELQFDLSRVARDGSAHVRMAVDKVNPHSFTVDDLLGRILQQCQAVFERQRAVPNSEFARDEVFRSLVTEMLETRAFARSKLLAWLEDDSLTADYMVGAVHGRGRLPPASVVRPHMRLAIVRPLTDWCSSSLRAIHRWRIAYWEQVAAGRRLPPTSAAAVRPHWGSVLVRPDTLELTPAGAALMVCRMRGLLRESTAERNADGETALVAAMNDGASIRTLDFLLQAGADVDAYNDMGTTNLPLCYAAECGNCVALGWLCRSGARLENRDKIGRTALIRAAGEGHSSAVELLLAAGADLDAADNNGMTATMFAARWGFTETAALLADRGADLYAVNAMGRTALMEAAANGQTTVVEALVVRGAVVGLSAAGPDGAVRTALDWAELSRHTATADALRSLVRHVIRS